MNTKLIPASGAALLLYAVCAVLRQRSFLNTHVTSAPTWMNYIGIVLEFVLVIVLLVVFAGKLQAKTPETALTGGLKILRVIGLIVIAAAGIVIGSKLAADSRGASKLPYILASVFHTLLYAGIWMLFTEALKLAGKK